MPRGCVLSGFWNLNAAVHGQNRFNARLVLYDSQTDLGGAGAGANPFYFHLNVQKGNTYEVTTQCSQREIMLQGGEKNKSADGGHSCKSNNLSSQNAICQF